MNLRDRVLAALRFEETDIVPYMLAIGEVVVEKLNHCLGREMDRGGGYILAPAKPVMPEVPVDNLSRPSKHFCRRIMPSLLSEYQSLWSGGKEGGKLMPSIEIKVPLAETAAKAGGPKRPKLSSRFFLENINAMYEVQLRCVRPCF